MDYSYQKTFSTQPEDFLEADLQINICIFKNTERIMILKFNIGFRGLFGSSSTEEAAEKLAFALAEKIVSRDIIEWGKYEFEFINGGFQSLN